MKKLKHLVCDMSMELDAAERYARSAVRCKEEDRALSETYARIAGQELEHCELFHAQGVRLIREAGEQAPAAMQAVWDWEHEKMIRRRAEIQALLSMA